MLKVAEAQPALHMIQTTGLTDVLREDSVNETLTLRNEEALSGASKTHNGFFVVPAILERNA